MEFQNNQDPYWGERKGLTTAAFACGIAALPLAYLTGIMGCMLGLMAIFFGIYSKGAAKLRSSRAVSGIIMGSIGFVFGAFMFGYALLYMSENMDELMKAMEGYQEFLNH